jgi:hypothetical protein
LEMKDLCPWFFGALSPKDIGPALDGFPFKG